MRNFWAKVLFCEFIRHYRKLDDATIVADVRQSMDDLEELLPSGNSFGAKMVRWSNERIEFNRETRGKKGGRPRKQKELEVLVKPTLPGTSSGNGEALNDEGATAPAGKSFEARQAIPGARHHGATGEHFEESRTPSAATTPVPVSAFAVPEQGALPPEASTGRGGKLSTPVPVSAHGDAAEGGLLTPWYGPAAGKSFDQEATRADARIREDRDASATVRAQHPDGDAATREGAVDNLTPQGDVRDLAPSPSDIQKRPGKSADIAGGSPNHGGSERGAGGTAIDAVRRSPGAKVPEPRLRYGSAGNVLMTATETAKLASEFGDVRQITEELSDYLLLHPNKYRSHYAALRNWCRRRVREGRNPDGMRMTQGDRLARHFAMREKEILDGKDAEEE